jgi:hypothetical protein
MRLTIANRAKDGHGSDQRHQNPQMKSISNILRTLTIVAPIVGLMASADRASASPVQFSSAVATFYQTGNCVGVFPSGCVNEGLSPSEMINGVFSGVNGWAVFNFATGQTEAADALFTIASPLAAGQYNLIFKIYQDYLGGPSGQLLGDFALAYTTASSPTLSSAQTPVSIQGETSINGTTFSLLSPGELLTSNPAADDTYIISASIDSTAPITGIFLDAIQNPTLPFDGPGQYSNGNFLVNQFTLDQTPLPAALPLFATALGGLCLLGWRGKRKAAGLATRSAFTVRDLPVHT